MTKKYSILTPLVQNRSHCLSPKVNAAKKYHFPRRSDGGISNGVLCSNHTSDLASILFFLFLSFLFVLSCFLFLMNLSFLPSFLFSFTYCLLLLPGTLVFPVGRCS